MHHFRCTVGTRGLSVTQVSKVTLLFPWCLSPRPLQQALPLLRAGSMSAGVRFKRRALQERQRRPNCGTGLRTKPPGRAMGGCFLNAFVLSQREKEKRLYPNKTHTRSPVKEEVRADAARTQQSQTALLLAQSLPPGRALPWGPRCRDSGYLPL